MKTPSPTPQPALLLALVDHDGFFLCPSPPPRVVTPSGKILRRNTRTQSCLSLAPNTPSQAGARCSSLLALFPVNLFFNFSLPAPSLRISCVFRAIQEEGSSLTQLSRTHLSLDSVLLGGPPSFVTPIYPSLPLFFQLLCAGCVVVLF